ncbi:MAG: hypothetical protein AAF471_05465 [Myxococcota bacterium]
MMNHDSLKVMERENHDSSSVINRNELPEHVAGREDDPRKYAEWILRGLVRCPERVGLSVDVDYSFLCRKVRVDLRMFEEADRARLVGREGETAAAVRRLLRSACAVRRRWGCLRYVNDDWSLSDEELRRGMPPPVPIHTPVPVAPDEDDFSPKDYLIHILRGLVRHPTRLNATAYVGPERTMLYVDMDTAAPDDRGRILGSCGATAAAVRCVVKAAGALRRRRCRVRFVGGRET